MIVKNSKIHGRGVFASKNYKKGSLVAEFPAMVIPNKQIKHLDKTVFSDYYFDDWNSKSSAICMGQASFLNHSKEPNLECDSDEKTVTFKFYAVKNIKKGEELFIDYCPGYTEDTLWFSKGT